ncbi:LLM class flavin-dependent oxidoreductase [Terribacillus saccharophilus]|uniref:LLM class flavin-dependent oxidoreductase n=1 Tax=Terribacillus saccharophilus TaxID=361277 RepID=UPI003982DF7C
MMTRTPLSVLDLSPVPDNKTPKEAFENSKQLIQHTEKLGYNRYWVAEHHNMPSIASSATSVLIGYLAGHSSTIRVGSGGVMLPNHSPLVIAEQFGTLATMYPDRIDLGLGRAPGTDYMTSRALRRDAHTAAERFPDDVQELLQYLGDDNLPIKAHPGHGTHVPVYLLGSSTFSAQLAAMLGLPFAFASHFAPGELHNALRLYRERFQPSVYLDKPYAMVTVNGIVADTKEEAEFLSTTLKLKFLSIIRGRSGSSTAPVESMDHIWNEHEKLHVTNTLTYSFVGDKEKVASELEAFHAKTQFDELIVSADIFDQEKRRNSYTLLSELWK